MTFDYGPGVWINYEVHGRGPRPALLLHGFGASLEMWRDLQPHLEPHLTLYLVDLKGFGLSSKTDDGRYWIEDQASIITAFLARLELSGVCLIGHSYGGMVALTAYLKLAETGAKGRIDSLVLIASPAATQRLPFFIAALRNPLISRLLRAAPARARARRVLRRMAFDPKRITERLVERYARFQESPESERALIAAAKQIVPKDPDYMTARLATVRAPSLILWGDHDRVVFRWQADLLKKLIPDSKLVVIPRCGHLPAEECPEETARQILRFLGA